MLYEDMGDHASAVPLFRQALEICRAALGEGHPYYANSLSSLAVLYGEMGDYASAEPLLRQALEVRRAALGEGHPDYAKSLTNLAILYVATDRGAESLDLMQKATAIDDRMIGQIFSIGSEHQRTAFLATLQYNQGIFISLTMNLLHLSREAVLAALDLILRRKALKAEGLATQRDAVLGGRYPQLLPRLRELQALRATIVQKTLSGPGPGSAPDHHRQLAEWARRQDDLERELARQVPEMNLEQKLRAADRRAVALGLPEGAALVEFVRFDVADFKAVRARGEAYWKPARYLALVLRAGDPEQPELIDLGEAGPIDRLIADFRDAILGGPESRNMVQQRVDPRDTPREDAGPALRAAVFDPLVPALGGRDRLILSPDGALAYLPFEVLPGGEGRRLIDDYRLSYLSCGRDVLRFQAESSGRPEAPWVMADPDFDLIVAQAQPVTRTGPTPAVTTTPHAPGRRSRDLDPGAFHFDRLPGTRTEGESVGRFLGVEPLFDAAALEGRLKSGCRSPRVLHLATHGFFLPDQPDDPAGDRPDPMGEFGGESGRFRGRLPENPMLRSGLALAGANTWLKGGTPPEAAEDGLLTAEDVSGLDLLATELVVLSACETGLGQVQVGEGVFGLRRAFMLAGARTLVMSLWKVPDEQTQELMVDFYQRLQAGEGRAEALRQTQLAMKAKYPDPYFWGAFICQGDPAPLTILPAAAAGA
jgi:CHAT domain-containing protein/tetratricopeptide (TPR) repeat protein